MFVLKTVGNCSLNKTSKMLRAVPPKIPLSHTHKPLSDYTFNGCRREVHKHLSVKPLKTQNCSDYSSKFAPAVTKGPCCTACTHRQSGHPV